ncbi:MAG: hypothetical protein ACKVRP_02720 [Bacteroidota bacterium]
MADSIFTNIICSIILGFAPFAYWQPAVYRRVYTYLMFTLGYSISLVLAFNFGVDTVADQFSSTWDENMWGTFAFSASSFGFSYKSILLFSLVTWVYLTSLLFLHDLMHYMRNDKR